MNLPYFDLSAKTALVSGGATGIGLGIATGLAEAGAQVAICSRRLDTCRQVAEELKEQTGASVFALELDVTKPRTMPTHGQADRGTLRRNRHFGELRRNQRRRKAADRHDRSGLGPGDQHQPQRGLHSDPGRGARHDQAGQRGAGSSISPP